MIGAATNRGTRTSLAAAIAWALLWGGPVACSDAAQDPGAAETPAEPALAEAPGQADGSAPAEAPGQADGSAPAEDAVAGPAGEAPNGVADGSDASVAQSVDPESPGSYWLLTEFDWGDDREVVYESTRFDPFYTCHRKSKGLCALTQVKVNGEDLLAHFHFNDRDRLFQVVFLTPDLDRKQADAHLHRVWKELADYVTRHKGEPETASELPELDSLELGPPRLTRLWRSEGLDVRLMVGRRDTDLFYVAAFFSDPSQPEAREAYLAELAASDRMFRERRADQAARPARRPPGVETDPPDDAG